MTFYLSYNKNKYKESDAADYIEHYSVETDALQEILTNYEPSLAICNNFYLDKCLWLSAETIKRYIEQSKIPSKTWETSPRRHEIRDAVRQNILINAQRMKDTHGKKKRVTVKKFKLGENVAVRVPKEDRGKVDPKRVPSVIVIVKGSNPTLYKRACKSGTIAGYFTSSDLISYPGVLPISTESEDHEITLKPLLHDHILYDIYYMII